MWATWCKNCLTMDKTTLVDPAVKAALDGYVKIKFQAEEPDESTRRRDVMQRFDAVGLPTYVILRPEDPRSPATIGIKSIPDNSTGRIRSHSGQTATRPFRGSVDVNATCERLTPDDPNRADRFIAVRAADGHLQRRSSRRFAIVRNRRRHHPRAEARRHRRYRVAICSGCHGDPPVTSGTLIATRMPRKSCLTDDTDRYYLGHERARWTHARETSASRRAPPACSPRA